MLPIQSRLRSSSEFSMVTRYGVRAGRPGLVLHVLRYAQPPSKAGFVVSKAVGNAVTRNRVKRQLRHLIAAKLAGTTVPVGVVVRALPQAVERDLRVDVDQTWAACMEKLAR